MSACLKVRPNSRGIGSRIVIALAVCCVSLLSLSDTLQATELGGVELGGVDSLESRFLQEGPLAWAEFDELAQLAQGRMVISRRDSELADRIETVITTRANQQGRVSIINSDPISGRMDEVLGANSRYAFNLNRMPGTSSWELAGSDDRAAAEYFIPDLRQRVEDCGALHRVLIRLPPIDLAQLIARPKFQVTSAAWDTVAGRQLARIDFVSPHVNPLGDQNNPYQEGTLWLDPERFWTLQSASLVNKFGTEMRVLTEISCTEVDPRRKVPLPARVISKSTRFVKGIDQSTTLEIDHRYELSIPTILPAAEELTLSAFGLAEPDAPGQNLLGSHRIWTWGAVVGAVLVIAGLMKLGVNNFRADPDYDD